MKVLGEFWWMSFLLSHTNKQATCWRSQMKSLKMSCWPSSEHISRFLMVYFTVKMFFFEVEIDIDSFFLPVMICNSFFWETLRVESKICKDMTKMTDTKCDQMSVCVPVPSQCCLYEDSLPNIFRLKALNKQKCSLKCLIPCKKKREKCSYLKPKVCKSMYLFIFLNSNISFFLAFIKIKIWWCLQNTGMWQ